MADSRRFNYVAVQNTQGEATLRPLLPLELSYRGQSVQATGLLDTGADVNVLPYHLGMALGAVWEEQSTAVQLSGNLANYEARGILLDGKVEGFEPVRLAFAWSESEHVPLILGQVNFFMVFNVCFYRTQQAFELESS